MKERLQKIISARGVMSRRKAEEWIAQGRVSVNGAVSCLGDLADADVDVILLDGKPLPSAQKTVYIMLHKPRGYVTTMSDEKGRKKVTDLIKDCPYRVYPVGRLDMDSEGLLLMTNDGEFANRWMHPRHEIDKTYHVVVKGFTSQAMERLAKPIILDGYQIREPQVSLLQPPDSHGKAVISVVIHEGRNRQVRRMCDYAGMEVVQLIRVSEHNLDLGDLPCGKWRYLSEEEKAGL